MGNCYVQNLLQTALNEVGYREKATNADLYDKTANAGSRNFTKYSHEIDSFHPNFYNGRKQGYAWCDQFVDWCFIATFGEENAKRLLCQPGKSAGAGCAFSMQYFKNAGRFGHSPSVGAQIFFYDSAGRVNHTGIVYDVDKSLVYTVEGNSGDGVKKCVYSIYSSKIAGYGYPGYDVVSGQEETPSTAKAVPLPHASIGEAIRYARPEDIRPNEEMYANPKDIKPNEELGI